MASESTVEDISTHLNAIYVGVSKGTSFLFRDSILDALRMQLMSNPASQETLDVCLQIGLNYIQTPSQQLCHGIAAVGVLVQFGAQWDECTLFNMDKTPYHIICQCPGDHYDVLNLMINSFGKTSLNVQDILGCTAVMYAIQNMNFECLRCLIVHGVKWDCSTLFHMEKTPYHIISQCPGDHHDVLNLMIKSFGKKSLNVKDFPGCTAVMYAVHTRNFECLRCLIAHGADVNLGNDFKCNKMTTPLIDAICADSASRYSTCVTRDTFNLLLESGVDVNQTCCNGLSPMKHAIHHNNMYCVRKLVQPGAQLNQAWFYAATEKNINVLRYLLELRVDKNCIDLHGRNVLWHAVNGGGIRVIGYLLEAGVTLTTNVKHQYDLICDMRTAWSRNITYLHVKQYATQWNPCMLAIALEKLDVAQLFEKYKQDSFQSIEYLKCAVRNNSLKMVNYLLSKYKYSLNMAYPHNCDSNSFKTYQTILTEACKPRQLEMVSLLMEHGADPAKKSYYRLYQSAFLIAINKGYNELVAHFIRSGVSLDCRLHDKHYGAVLPFEYAVYTGNKQAAEMLLHAGFSFGKFKLDDKIVKEFFQNSSPELQKLMIMIERNVHENNVQPLYQLSRKSILNHLCPGAAKKITELKFSVFSITESWLKDYNKDVYNLVGYEHICKIRKNRPGGGVSIYIKNSIKYNIRENLFIDVDGVDSISVEIPKEEFKTQKILL